jgi:hypothetical protein
MRRLVLWWKLSGTQKRLKAAIVNYVDDLVICCKGTADLAMQMLREVTKKLQLEVNEDKTRICRVPAASFDFLGYRFGRCYSRKTGKAYLGTTPSGPKVHCATLLLYQSCFFAPGLRRVARNDDHCCCIFRPHLQLGP